MNNNEEQNVDWETIANVLTGEADSQSVKSFGKRLLQDENLRDDFDTVKKHWSVVNEVIVKENIDVGKAWNKQKNRVENYEENQKDRQLIVHTVIRVAVVFILVVSAVVLYTKFNPSRVEYITTGTFEEKKVSLPDGSVVFLNADSEINFGGADRNVHLKGEAFFEVVRNTEKPFIVILEKGSVEVLGTMFNINASKPGEVKVFVERGKVKYTGQREGGNILAAGDLLIDQVGTVKIDKNENPNLISWKTNHVIFEEAQLGEVFDILSHAYKRKIIYDQIQLSNCILTAEYNNLPIDEVLEAISAIFNLTFSIDAENIEIYGNGC